MKNLENYGVQELNAKEIREANGGFIIIFYLIYKAFSSDSDSDGDGGGGGFGGGGASGGW